MLYWTYLDLALVTALVTATLTAGLRLLAARLKLPPATAARIVAGVPLAIIAWLAAAGLLADSGFLADWHARPPHLVIIPVTALAAVVLTQRSALVGRLLEATPRHWPVALQSFRIGVELAFWGLFAAGGAPVQVTFEGRNFDVLVGLTAPLVALAIRRWKLAPRFVLAWNALGLAILSNTIVTTFTSTPGPLHLHWAGEPFTAFASWPFVWIPAFLAPLAIFLHVFSIRQNLATAAAAAHPIIASGSKA